MQALVFGLALSAVVALGTTAFLAQHRDTQAHGRLLQELEHAVIAYTAEHCAALPATVTPADLQTTGHLSAAFDPYGVTFTVNLANHPITTIEARNAPPVLTYLARNTLGRFAAGAYTFVPNRDVTFSRAANPGYNLFTYAAYNGGCGP